MWVITAEYVQGRDVDNDPDLVNELGEGKLGVTNHVFGWSPGKEDSKLYKRYVRINEHILIAAVHLL